jgi:hypothetical protein
MANDAEVDCWVEEPGKRMKVERVGDNARITIYDVDGSSKHTATVAYWRWERVLRLWPQPATEGATDAS